MASLIYKHNYLPACRCWQSLQNKENQKHCRPAHPKFPLLCSLKTHPAWHLVSVRQSVVIIQNHDGCDDAWGHHEHDAVEVCAWTQPMSKIIVMSVVIYWSKSSWLKSLFFDGSCLLFLVHMSRRISEYLVKVFFGTISCLFFFNQQLSLLDFCPLEMPKRITRQIRHHW